METHASNRSISETTRKADMGKAKLEIVSLHFIYICILSRLHCRTMKRQTKTTKIVILISSINSKRNECVFLGYRNYLLTKLERGVRGGLF